MFKLHTNFKPSGDQPEAIKKLMDNFNKGINEQILLDARGTGKTFMMANIIEKLDKKL